MVRTVYMISPTELKISLTTDNYFEDKSEEVSFPNTPLTPMLRHYSYCIPGLQVKTKSIHQCIWCSGRIDTLPTLLTHLAVAMSAAVVDVLELLPTSDNRWASLSKLATHDKHIPAVKTPSQQRPERSGLSCIEQLFGTDIIWLWILTKISTTNIYKQTQELRYRRYDVHLLGQSRSRHSQKPHPRCKQCGFLWYYNVVVP